VLKQPRETRRATSHLYGVVLLIIHYPPMNLTLILAGKPRQLNESVFKQLKIIITAYNQLANSTDVSEQISAITALLKAVTAEKISVTKLKTGELEQLLKALPELCQLSPEDDKKTGKAFNCGDIYAHLSSCYGWTYDNIDNQMTLSRLHEYEAYQRENPPTHLLVKAYLGYEYHDQKAGNAFLAAIAAQVKGQTKQ
jgi:hypothetical protein